MEKLAEKVAELVIEKLHGPAVEEVNDYVEAKEAARILGVSPSYLRSMKKKFTHVKVGSHNQGRVLFKKSDLMKNYLSSGNL